MLGENYNHMMDNASFFVIYVCIPRKLCSVNDGNFFCRGLKESALQTFLLKLKMYVNLTFILNLNPPMYPTKSSQSNIIHRN